MHTNLLTLRNRIVVTVGIRCNDFQLYRNTLQNCPFFVLICNYKEVNDNIFVLMMQLLIMQIQVLLLIAWNKCELMLWKTLLLLVHLVVIYFFRYFCVVVYKKAWERTKKKIVLMWYQSMVCQLSFCSHCIRKLCRPTQVISLFWKIETDRRRNNDADLERHSYQSIVTQKCCSAWLINNGQCFDCIFPSSESFSVCKMKYNRHFCLGRLGAPMFAVWCQGFIPAQWFWGPHIAGLPCRKFCLEAYTLLKPSTEVC